MARQFSSAPGQSLVLNPASFVLADVNSGTRPFTISFWFKPTSLISVTSRYAFYWRYTDATGTSNTYQAIIWEYVNNSLEFFAPWSTGTDPRIGSQIALSDTNWHHIA